ncbi:MAG TPA: TonB-dependent receptor [Terriglobia bacterium]|nr:TonB-dependent receptor [Terriglobia bacterium]
MRERNGVRSTFANRELVFKVSVFLVLVSLRGLPALAQGTTAEILGTVKDTTGAVLPGVSIAIVNVATGQERNVTSDSRGNYAAPGLPVGEYFVRATLPNFKTQIRDGVILQVAARVQVDLTLELGEVSEAITVIESVPLLRSTNAEVGEVISNQRLLELPLNGRQFVNLALLSDNVVTEPGGTRGAALNLTGPTFAVAGQRGGHNMYYLDGVSLTDQYFNNLSIAPSVDAVREFNVQKSLYAAEYGGKAAAAVSAVTKSGTNDLHGSVYEFLRNSALDARNFFERSEPAPLRRNQFGGTLGGPIQRDKTFFFLNYEGLRERRAQTRTFSVPSPAVRGGDFSAVGSIRDPLTGLPFENSRIPAGRLNRAAQAFLQNVPLPNIPGAGEVQNFVASPTERNDQDQFTVRVDRTLGPQDTVFSRFTFADMETFRPFGSSALNETLLPGFGTAITTRTSNLALNHTHIFSPSLIHEFRFGYLRVTGGQEGENNDVDFGGANGIAGVTRDPRKFGFPIMNVSNTYSTMGDPSTLVSRRNNSFDFFSNLSWVRGAHSMKFGVYLYRLRFNPQDSPNARGSFVFTGRFTGNAFADFLLGYPFTAQGGIGRGEEDGRTLWSHFYAQDDWRATPNLMVNVGYRHEINGHMKETGNRISNIEIDRFVIASDEDGNIHPDANALLSAIPVPYVTTAEAGQDRSLLRPSYRRISPRLGLAWTPGGGNTVVRTGGGFFYNQWAYSVQTALMKNLPFYFNKSVTVDTFHPGLNIENVLNAPNTGSIGGAGVEYDFHTEYAASWSFSLQRMLSENWLAEASYFGSKIVGADDNTFENVPFPGPGPIAARRPNPALSSFQVLHWGGWSLYNSLTLRVEKRLSYGLMLNSNYTWSKALDPASSPGATESEYNIPQDVRNRRAEKALASFDRRHRLVFSYSYDLPIGPGRMWNPASGWAGKLLEGWTLAGLGTFQSGAPFTVNIPTDNANIGAGPAQRPDLLRNPNLDSSQQTPEHWFDTGAFAAPAPFTFGNAGRNIVFADGTVNVDFSLLKRTSVSETSTLEFRAEFFNVFNNTNFAGVPGRIAFTPNFGRYFSAENPRQIQLGLKLTF